MLKLKDAKGSVTRIYYMIKHFVAHAVITFRLMPLPQVSTA